MLRVRHLLDKTTSPMYIWDVNLENCFDTISHEFLENETKNFTCPITHRLICKWLKTGIIENGIITKPTCGMLQVGVIFPLLCNVTLNGIENVVRQGVTSQKPI
jgi:RNA-directed DNA polymerase